MLTRKQFKEIYRRVRMISKARYVGTHGHLSDLVKEYGVTMQFLREVREATKKPKKPVYGRYSTEYQENERQAVVWDSYYERRIGA